MDPYGRSAPLTYGYMPGYNPPSHDAGHNSDEHHTVKRTFRKLARERYNASIVLRVILYTEIVTFLIAWTVLLMLAQFFDVHESVPLLISGTHVGVGLAAIWAVKDITLSAAKGNKIHMSDVIAWLVASLVAMVIDAGNLSFSIRTNLTDVRKADSTASTTEVALAYAIVVFNGVLLLTSIIYSITFAIIANDTNGIRMLSKMKHYTSAYLKLFSSSSEEARV